MHPALVRLLAFFAKKAGDEAVKAVMRSGVVEKASQKAQHMIINASRHPAVKETISKARASIMRNSPANPSVPRSSIPGAASAPHSHNPSASHPSASHHHTPSPGTMQKSSAPPLFSQLGGEFSKLFGNVVSQQVRSGVNRALREFIGRMGRK